MRLWQSAAIKWKFNVFSLISLYGHGDGTKNLRRRLCSFTVLSCVFFRLRANLRCQPSWARFIFFRNDLFFRFIVAATFSLCETITMFGIIHSEFSLSYVCVCVWMMCLCWCCIYADNSIYYNNMVFTWKQLLVSQRFDDNARRLWWVVWKCFCVNWNRVCGSGNCGMMVCDVWIGFTKPVWPYCVYVILVHTHHENDDLDTVRLSIWALHNIVLYWMCIC